MWCYIATQILLLFGNSHPGSTLQMYRYIHMYCIRRYSSGCVTAVSCWAVKFNSLPWAHSVGPQHPLRLLRSSNNRYARALRHSVA
ncbi:uncharacterized protein GGS22DRAFT_126886 [Annulohypoxylon maeteangense]|uniref:uncharacterized protein n=1 Tax=Annulohypoxylon maeteangense TaxID=1927788 RepID=UPI002008168C|nr:uncharacterized protein GGS22DRAFT_126886 [Annulohypoxylon maeteangense]KAI0886279.1 hypothetical protein GGS22DRAFT_126886 [Annulohypoxylon maeteangense]